MSDQGSTYAIIQSLPLMVSPLYKLPNKISILSELKVVPEDVTKLPVYPFSVEREVIAQVEIARKKLFEEEEAFQLKKKQYEDEKIQQQKVAARKIAPGFLDTDTRILQPQPTLSSEFPKESLSPKTQQQQQQQQQEIKPAGFYSDKMNTQFDYHKFEQGLAPADPWDTPENDMMALKSLLGTHKSDQNPTPPYTSSLYPQAQQTITSYPKNEGVYWNFQQTGSNTNVSSMNSHASPQLLQRQLHAQPVPALPPKLFNNSPLPTSSTSSPTIAPPTLPPPSEYHRSISMTPPPLPPLPIPQPTLASEHLITELSNMGFTRAQASNALQMSDHDLIKATHFLLDQA